MLELSDDEAVDLPVGGVAETTLLCVGRGGTFSRQGGFSVWPQSCLVEGAGAHSQLHMSVMK